VWNVFSSGLRNAALFMVGTGAIVAAAAASLIRPAPLGEPIGELWALIRTEPQSTVWRAARGATFLALGVWLALDRETLVNLALTLAGAYLVYEGVRILLWLVYKPRLDEQVTPRPEGRRRFVPLLLAAATVLLAATALASEGELTIKPPALGACNGDRTLCNKRLEEISIVATHNSMSAPLPGWFFSEQNAPIPDQLKDGVRGLLIDTYEADLLPNGRHRTVFEDANAKKQSELESGLSPDAVEAALRIRDRLGFEGQGKRGLYLCHGFCEIGATSLPTVLGQLRAFMITNPGEVVVIVHQDQITPAQWVGAIRDAGLDTYAYDGDVRQAFPTLREMIRSDKRLVILNENQAGSAPWNHLAYEGALKETPFAFTRVGQLNDPKQRPASCAANRGTETAPLFLLNHWVNTPPSPRPSLAAQVNAYGPMLARARACQRLRGALPNLLAVNFYRQGEPFKVARTLNELSIDP
jgi:hypothetical protein